jgi:hypothetical protein
MTANRVSRRAGLTMLVAVPSALLAACGGPSRPRTFAPLSWDYLPPIKLNVASIEIDDSWMSRDGREVGFLAPMSPKQALRRMAEDRLVAGGTSGRAKFVIEAASIVRSDDTYVGNFAVELSVGTANGTRSGYAEARVYRTQPVDDDSPEGVRAELYDLVKRMMTDMNVEFEYQVRKSLRDYLQTTSPAAPRPAPVEQQQLGPPPGAEQQQLGPPSPAPGPPGSAPAPPTPPPLPPPPRPSAVPFSSPAPTPLSR